MNKINHRKALLDLDALNLEKESISLLNQINENGLANKNNLFNNTLSSIVKVESQDNSAKLLVSRKCIQ